MYYILNIFLMIVLISCKDEIEQPKVIYDEKLENKTTIDSSQIKVSDLPIWIEGTDYLIHPIGDVNIYESDLKSSYRNQKNNISYSMSNYNRFELTGNLQNILFQHKDKDSLKPLTNKKINILTATYLYENALKNNNKLMIYTLIDQDTNKDGIIDQNDIKSLYLSKINGSGFQKITLDFQELIDWNVLNIKNRLYYRAIDDSNKNGRFDKNDKIHYCYIDLNDNLFKVIEYYPI